MGKTIRHLVIDIRGVLGWSNKKLARLFQEDGKFLTAEQAKEYLYDKLSEGYRVLPFGEECEGFDKVKGCPGHRVEDIPSG